MEFDEQFGLIERGTSGVRASAQIEHLYFEIDALWRMHLRANDFGGHRALWDWVRAAPDRKELQAARAALRDRIDRYENKRWLASQRYRREERA
jgi:hypothetical protein